MNENARRPALFVALSVLLIAPALAGGNRTAFAAPDFSSCAVSVDCPPESCSLNRFELASNCNAGCSTSAGAFGCFAVIQTFGGPSTWEVSSILTLGFQVGDTPNIQATFDIEGTRVSPELLELVGRIDVIVTNQNALIQGGAFELAVFRFAGDPAEFDGVKVDSVQQLVMLGIIEPEDILFVENLDYPAGKFEQTFSFDVDVTGVPDDEIVLFASETQVRLVPALSELGVVLLVALMLAAATYALRKRRRA